MKENEFLKLLGEKIVTHRKAISMTQQELANRLQTTNTHLRRVENGKVSCGIIFLNKVAEELGVSINDLIKPDYINIKTNTMRIISCKLEGVKAKSPVYKLENDVKYVLVFSRNPPEVKANISFEKSSDFLNKSESADCSLQIPMQRFEMHPYDKFYIQSKDDKLEVPLHYDIIIGSVFEIMLFEFRKFLSSFYVAYSSQHTFDFVVGNPNFSHFKVSKENGITDFTLKIVLGKKTKEYLIPFASDAGNMIIEMRSEAANIFDNCNITNNESFNSKNANHQFEYLILKHLPRDFSGNS